MALGGGAQPIKSVRCAGHRGIETERQHGRLEVVVNGLGHAHHGQALFVKLLGNAQRPIAPDADQRPQAELLTIRLGLLENLARD